MTWSESVKIKINVHWGIKEVENTYTKADSLLKSNRKDIGFLLEAQYLSIDF